MIEPLLAEVAREVSGPRTLEALTAIAGFHRVQASPGYDAAAQWMAEALERAGLAVELEHVAGDGVTRRLGGLMPEGWTCERAVATLHDGARSERLCDYDAVKLSLVLRSAPAAGRHRIVALEDGTEDAHYDGVDVRDRVVLTRGPVHRVLELAVRERGAAGLLFDGRRELPPVRGPFDDADAVTYTSFWWNGDEPRGWGFVVSPGTGARLRERLRDRAPLELEVAIDARAFPTRIPLLSAVIPGATAQEALVVSHLCHPQPSANDNASGAAANLESARALAAIARRRGVPARRGVRFLWVPELTGTYAWLGADPARASRLAAALNLDMVGQDQAQCGSTLLVEHPPCFAGTFAEPLLVHVRERAQDWVTSYSGPGHYSLVRMAEVPYSGGSDHVVFADPANGVPCPLLIQWPDRYYHSSHDTPDRADPASLALAARSAATYAGFLADAGEDEVAWLAALTARDARRRVLRAADDPTPDRPIAAARLRGVGALESLRRLDAPGDRLRVAVAAFESFCRNEGLEGRDAPPASGERRPEPAPVRAHGAPLEWLRHLLPGWRTLARDDREAFRSFERAVPGGAATLELAWAACDGRRGVDEIARLVWLETGQHAPEAIRDFFGWTQRLGVSTMTDARA